MTIEGPGRIHDNASDGFGRRAQTYQQARPSYHPGLVERFVERFGGGQVLDIGAGTGIFTGQLVEHGVAVTAVEPVAQMREQLQAALPGVKALDGTAEAIPVETGSTDTVVVAQAFHWFSHGPALDEIARVLRPGGILVTAWNVRDVNSEPMRLYTDITTRHAGDTPRHGSMIWRQAIDGDERFELVDDWHVDNPKLTDVEGVVGRALSTSFIASLPADDQERVSAELREAIAPFGPSILFGYRSELQAWQRS